MLSSQTEKKVLFLCTVITVIFKLESEKEDFSCTVPKGVFRTIDNQKKHNPFFAKTEQASSDTEEECEITLPYIYTREEYEHFKAFWETDLAVLPAEDKELSQYQRDLTQDLFDSFLLAADFLNIQGKHAKRFAKNMVRYGLLGKHSKDIVNSSQCKDKHLPHDTFWGFLHAFLDQKSFKCRTIDHPSTKKKTLLIEKSKACLKQNNKEHEYVGATQTARTRVVLYSELGVKGTQEDKRNKAVLSWLLLNMGGASVDIQYPIEIASKDISELSNTVQNFTKENEKGTCVYVEGVTLNVYHSQNFSLAPALQLVLGISRLKLSITIYYIFNLAPSSFFSSITLCTSLKALEITGQDLDSVAISRLVEGLPNIEQLSLACKILEGTAIDNLKKCAHLESLEMFGAYQPSTIVTDLIRHLLSLKRLRIWCQALNPAAAKSFKACVCLEKLEIEGAIQPRDAVQELARHIPFLKELKIACNSLSSTNAESFKECVNLENLVMLGKNQPSAAVQELVRHLSTLKELCITCQALDPAAAESFQACKRLEKLSIFGKFQPSIVVQEIIRHLSRLKELKIICRVLKSTAAKSFEVCPHLEKMHIWGKTQTSATVQALTTRLSSLRELLIGYQPLEPAVAESFQACKKLEKLSIFGKGSVSFLVKLLEALPSLQELQIKIDIADLALAITLRRYPNLRALDLTVDQYTPGFIECYMQDPLPKVEYLELYNSDTKNNYSEEDTTAVDKARAMGIVIFILGGIP
ncbi:hypothetical protein NECID01_1419 [Nematocida sp. AWRm77]|nr:hypothetical protein NECID01_1419 [Nematocida sp. AWRm77]